MITRVANAIVTDLMYAGSVVGSESPHDHPNL